MLRFSLCCLFLLAALAVLPSSILPSNASNQSDHSQSLVDEAREAHQRKRTKALGEHLGDSERIHDESKRKLRKADLAHHHRLRAASDSLYRSKSNGEDEGKSFQKYIDLTEKSEIEHALQTLKIHTHFDYASVRNNQLLDEKLSEADRRLANVFRNIQE